MQATMTPFIRWAIRRDLITIIEIENLSFEYPWSEQQFVNSLRQRNVIAQVAEVDEEVVGYIVYCLHKDRIDIWNLAVHPDYRRQHVGSALVEHLKRKLSFQRRKYLLTEVRERNLEAQQFFASCDLKAVEIMRDYYDDTDEDCYVFEFKIGDDLW